MARVTINGVHHESSNAKATEIWLTVHRIIDSGDTRILVLDGDGVKTAFRISDSTQVVLELGDTADSGDLSPETLGPDNSVKLAAEYATDSDTARPE